MEHTGDEGLLRRYLLGELMPQEQSEVQDRLFLDPDFSDELLMVERELTDDYLFGNLSPLQHARFEQYFLRAPERQLKMRIAQDLSRQVSTGVDRQAAKIMLPRLTFSWRWFFLNPRIVASAVMILLVAILLWLLRDRQVLKSELDEMRARQDAPQQQDSRDAQQPPGDRPSPEEPARSGEQLPKQQPGADSPLTDKTAIARVDRNPGLRGEPDRLWPDQTRGAGRTNLIRIRLGAENLLVQIDLDEARYPSYKVEIKDENNVEIWSATGFKAKQTTDGKALIVSVPSALFKEGNYIITVRGAKTKKEFVRVDSYQVVVKKE